MPISEALFWVLGAIAFLFVMFMSTSWVAKSAFGTGHFASPLLDNFSNDL